MIRPPSDIVLDVARAADPVRLAQAQARLGADASAAPIGGAKPTSFDIALRQISSTRPTGAAPPAPLDPAASAYRGLEEVLLARLVEAMLPGKASVYGGGAAGRVWRGFMAEHLARAVAQGGGVGVAARLAPSGPAPARAFAAEPA